MNDTAAKICGHRCPEHQDWTPCQLPPAHNPAGGHRDSAGDDVQHVWQHHGHDIQAESTAIMLNATSASWSQGQLRLLVVTGPLVEREPAMAPERACHPVRADLLKPPAREARHGLVTPQNRAEWEIFGSDWSKAEPGSDQADT